MTKAESPFSGEPKFLNIDRRVPELDMTSIKEKIDAANSFMAQSNFGVLINKFAEMAKGQINLDYDFFHWGDIDRYSNVITVFWDAKLIDIESEGEMEKAYSAKAIAIEMTVEGTAILRGEESEEHPNITLAPEEWKNNKIVQERAFVDTFIHPKIVTILTGDRFEDPFEEVSAGYEIHD